MFQRYELEPAVWHEKSIVFEWDSDIGAIRGPDAEKVKNLVDMAISDGRVTSHPNPTNYGIEDPLHRPYEMAAILGIFWVLPADLAKRLPTVEMGEASETPLF